MPAVEQHHDAHQIGPTGQKLLARALPFDPALLADFRIAKPRQIHQVPAGSVSRLLAAFVDHEMIDELRFAGVDEILASPCGWSAC